MQQFDAIVLGAGIVGVSAAANLLRHGKSVAIVDRRGPGEETSYGNSGVIERDGFVPIGFPDRLGDLLRYALNQSTEVRYRPSFLPTIAPWLWALKRASSQESVKAFAKAMDPLLAAAASEHRSLAEGADALQYFRDTGWLRIYRSERGFANSATLRRYAREYGVAYEEFSPAEAARLEPNLEPRFTRAIVFPETVSVSSPGGVTKAYASAFVAQGGRILAGDALSLKETGGRWVVDTAEGPLEAPVAVVALGPWSMDLLAPLGYRLPFAVKRGYHRHYRPNGNASLSRPVVDIENGFVIAPMEKGMRVTTGIEFANRDAAATPVQLDQVLPLARELFPLGEPVDEPWLGRRPCFPDSMPVVGWAPRHPGLFLDFGHGHLGLTLGPATGRLAAEMITGERPFTDPRPFGVERFGGG